MVESRFSAWEAEDDNRDLVPLRVGAEARVVERDTEQVHLGVRGRVDRPLR